LRIICDEDERWFGNVRGEQGEGLEDEVDGEEVNENELGFAVSQEYGDGLGVEAGVDVVEDGSRHGDSEVEFEHGGNIGGHDGDHLGSADEGGDGGSQLETSTVGLGPCVSGGGVVDDGGAVAVDDRGSLQEV
jgi:hypothetical protein